MTTDLLILAAGVVVLYLGADGLVRGAVRLAGAVGIPPIVVGLTVVSLGTSAPELVVCIVANLRGSGDLAVGNVLGSNLANIGLILGLTATIRPLEIASKVVSREVLVMFVVTLLLYPLVHDLLLDRADGAFLLLVLVAYLWFVFGTARSETPEVLGEYATFARQGVSAKEAWRDGVVISLGMAGLVLGGHLIVTGATSLATALGASELVIGLTVVAVGTSLPELATSLLAAIRREADIAVGNIIGSNIFNVAAILGVGASIRPISVSESVLTVELPGVLLLSGLLLPIAWTGNRIRRWEGALLLAAYVAIGFWVFAV